MDKKNMLMQLIQQYEGGNKTRFAKRLGLTPQGISTWISRGTIDYELIYSKCEGLNAAWLLSGEGPMLKPTKQYSIQEPTLQLVSEPQPEYKPLNESLIYNMYKDEKEEKERMLKEKDAKIDQLQTDLLSKSEELAAFKAHYPDYSEVLDFPRSAKPVATKPHSSTSVHSASSVPSHPQNK